MPNNMNNATIIATIMQGWCPLPDEKKEANQGPLEIFLHEVMCNLRHN